METYLIMGKFTEKGITNIKQTTELAENNAHLNQKLKQIPVVVKQGVGVPGTKSPEKSRE